MILCLGPTPAAQRVMVFPQLVVDSVNRTVKTLEGAAGKSINVAKVLKSLGEHPVATGFLGGDRGGYLKAVLASAGIESDFVTVSPRTRECITVINECAGTQTELVEESRPVPEADYQKLSDIVKRRLPGCRAAVMSGTLTPGAPADFYQQCAKAANHAGALSVVDAQGPALLESLKAAPGLVKPNKAELANTLGRQLRDDAALISAMREFRQLGAQRMVVTSGKAPALAFDGQTFWKIL